MNKRVCVVGAGNWGKNHISIFHKLGVLSGIVESNSTILSEIKSKYPDIKFFKNITDSINDNFDAFTVATPAHTHYEIGKKIINAKKDLLIEKPITTNLEDAIKLNNLAKKNNIKLMVGHSLLFHPAYIKMKDMIDNGMLGKLQYIYSNRVNLGKIRTEENVLWSFAPHDIALFQYLIGNSPIKINSVGNDVIQPGIHDTTITTIEYPDKIMGHIFVSWLHPFKEHRFVVVGSKGMLHFEDSFENKPLIFYNKNIEWKNNIPDARYGNEKYIDYENSLPLDNELKYFVDNLDNKVIEKSNGDSAIEIMNILTTASKQLLKE